jgi:hypothetical protein
VGECGPGREDNWQKNVRQEDWGEEGLAKGIRPRMEGQKNKNGRMREYNWQKNVGQKDCGEYAGQRHLTKNGNREMRE